MTKILISAAMILVLALGACTTVQINTKDGKKRQSAREHPGGKLYPL